MQEMSHLHDNNKSMNLETNLPVVITKIYAAFKAAEVLVNAVTMPHPSLAMAGAAALVAYFGCSAIQSALPSEETKAKKPSFSRRFGHFLIRPIELK